jgi:hypothetical protein
LVYHRKKEPTASFAPHAAWSSVWSCLLRTSVSIKKPCLSFSYLVQSHFYHFHAIISCHPVSVTQSLSHICFLPFPLPSIVTMNPPIKSKINSHLRILNNSHLYCHFNINLHQLMSYRYQEPCIGPWSSPSQGKPLAHPSRNPGRSRDQAMASFLRRLGALEWSIISDPWTG